MANALYVLAFMASLAVLAEAATYPQSTQNAYCNVPTCNGRPHTLCIYPFLQPSVRCGVVSTAQLTSIEIQELLEVHSKLNQATSVPLKWDQELADMAQTWADQCELRVDQCRNVPRFTVTQSYSFSRTSGPFVTRFYELVNLNAVPRGATLVGCGAIRYNADGRLNTTLLVCNYASSYYYKTPEGSSE